VVISDSAMGSLPNPTIEVGLRGLSYIEVAVTGPNRDLHSGVYGGAVANPITILAQMLAALHDDHNRVTIPGFYDDVVVQTGEERKVDAEAPFDEDAYKQDLGVASLWGEYGYTTRERASIRPTLEINGIWGGYTGLGAKTVLPSKAFVKISCRLVQNQSSGKMTRLLEDYLRRIAPPSVQVEVRALHGGEPFLTPVCSPAYQAAAWAVDATLGRVPFPVRGGATIPIIRLLEEQLGIQAVLLGFGLDSDNLHSPNEHLELENFYKGIETIPWFHRYYASIYAMGFE
jgi:acetylornithine deacetylase/succinyl-diaminopimelate desuccinylase-like protein